MTGAAAADAADWLLGQLDGTTPDEQSNAVGAANESTQQAHDRSEISKANASASSSAPAGKKDGEVAEETPQTAPTSVEGESSAAAGDASVSGTDEALPTNESKGLDASKAKEGDSGLSEGGGHARTLPAEDG